MKLNLDQVLSLTRTILKVVGSALMTHGATKAAAIVNGEDVTGLVLTIVGIIWSHWEHTPDEAPKATASGGNVIGLWLTIGLLAMSLGAPVLMTGCGTTPQRASFQAAGTTQITVETALRAYNEFAKAGKTTVAQNQQVKAAYEKYQVAMLVVCDAGEIYASMSGGTNSPAASLALQAAVGNANTEINDVVRLIQSFGVKF